jgi:hypothetical protein
MPNQVEGHSGAGVMPNHLLGPGKWEREKEKLNTYDKVRKNK